MAWSQLDGLMLISGAMGIFDRETVIKAGGYSINTVGKTWSLYSGCGAIWLNMIRNMR